MSEETSSESNPGAESVPPRGFKIAGRSGPTVDTPTTTMIVVARGFDGELHPRSDDRPMDAPMLAGWASHSIAFLAMWDAGCFDILQPVDVPDDRSTVVLERTAHLTPDSAMRECLLYAEASGRSPDDIGYKVPQLPNRSAP